jgi:hypothetical protein
MFEGREYFLPLNSAVLRFNEQGSLVPATSAVGISLHLGYKKQFFKFKDIKSFVNSSQMIN